MGKARCKTSFLSFVVFFNGVHLQISGVQIQINGVHQYLHFWLLFGVAKH